MTEPDENGYRYIRMTDFAFERMTAGFVGRALTLLNVEASNAAHPTPETRWHGHRLQQKWTNGAGEFEWCDIAETEETMERE